MLFVFVLLTASYYLMTSKVTAKASVLFTTTCAFGMLISLLQSIGIIGTMTVEFPLRMPCGKCNGAPLLSECFVLSRWNCLVHAELWSPLALQTGPVLS